MSTEFNPVGWFEVPVTDMTRAMQFYEKDAQAALAGCHRMTAADVADPVAEHSRNAIWT